MAEIAVARRYARALFETARKNGQIEQVEEDLKTVDQVLRALPALYRILRAPTVPAPRKRALLGRAFGDRLSPLATRFLQVLVDHRRETVLAAIYTEFQRLANEARNILPVEVTAAVPLTDQERQALADALARRTGKRILVELSIDPAILGGVIVRMGDTVIDGSVRSKLEQLRHRLVSWRVA